MIIKMNINNWLPVGLAHYFHLGVGEPKVNHLRKVNDPAVWFTKPYNLPPMFFFHIVFIALNTTEWVLTFLVNYHNRHIGYVKLFLFIHLYITFCERKQVFLAKIPIADNPRFIITIQTLNWKEISIIMFILHVAREKMVFQSVFQVLSPIIHQ